MERTHIVLTAVGPDATGLVSAITEFLYDRDANIEDSRMAILGGEFAIVMLASGKPGVEAAVRDGLAGLGEQTGLIFQVRQTKAGGTMGTPSTPCVIQAVAMDHPGIVHRLSHLVTQQGANIESLDTHTTPAPTTGTPLFTVRIVCRLPVQVDFDGFKEELAKVADELDLDLCVA